MTPEQLEQAARIVCKKRGYTEESHLQLAKYELTAFMQLAEACDEVLTEEATA